MDKFELLARRYCAFLGEDPDDTIEGLPVWRIALADLEAAINALDTFGIDVREPFKDVPDPDIHAPKRPKPKITRVA
ncbi:MAG: hypothetical protein AAF719_02535 [Pseudomonadota bacterium]